MRYCFFALMLLCLFVLPVATRAEEATLAKQAIIVDMGTGMVLLKKNADEKMPTSSMSKVMTGYMIFDAIKQGKISMDTEFPVSERAWSKQGSKMFIHVGDMVKVGDLLKGLIIQSGNDAAITLAEGLSGSEDAFAALMTQRARQMGMTNTNLVNASGWPDPNHYSTANDLAILAQRLIVDFPSEYTLYSVKDFTYNGITQGNRNPLLYRDIGVDGIKTGHTEDAGYGLMASGEKNGRRVVMVVNGLSSMQERADESARLMSWALTNFENITVVSQGQVIDKVSAALADVPSLPLTVGRDVRVTVPVGQKDNIKLKAEYDSPVKAPLAKGDQIGNLHISVPQIGDFIVPLVAAEDLPEAGFINRAMGKLKILLLGE